MLIIIVVNLLTCVRIKMISLCRFGSITLCHGHALPVLYAAVVYDILIFTVFSSYLQRILEYLCLVDMKDEDDLLVGPLEQDMLLYYCTASQWKQIPLCIWMIGAMS